MTTPTALPSIAWSTLLLRATETAGGLGIDVAHALRVGLLARGERTEVDAHAVLAMLLHWWADLDPDGYRTALRDIAGTDDVDPLAGWIGEAVVDYLAYADARVRALDGYALDARAIAAHAAAPADPAGRHLRWLDDDAEAALAGHWLVDLAANMARQRPRGLAIGSMSSPVAHGLAYIKQGVVYVDATLDPARLTFVVAHELAHHLDPAFAKHGRASGEWFADRLAELLITNQVTTVAAAAPLIAWANAERPSATYADWTTPSLFAWSDIDLTRAS